MHGNLWCWCQERIKSDVQGKAGSVIEDKEDKQDVNDGEGRVMRGGMWLMPGRVVLTEARTKHLPTNRDIGVGFRPARTIR
jgi:formylglycine-generating enzyme required for sulfatase activity